METFCTTAMHQGQQKHIASNTCTHMFRQANVFYNHSLIHMEACIKHTHCFMVIQKHLESVNMSNLFTSTTAKQYLSLPLVKTHTHTPLNSSTTSLNLASLSSEQIIMQVHHMVLCNKMSSKCVILRCVSTVQIPCVLPYCLQNGMVIWKTCDQDPKLTDVLS